MAWCHFVQALDILGSTEWRVNRPILDVVESIWSKGGGIAGLVDRVDVSRNGYILFVIKCFDSFSLNAGSYTSYLFLSCVIYSLFFFGLGHRFLYQKDLTRRILLRLENGDGG